MKKLTLALATASLFGAAHAAPAPQPSVATLVAPNDGYVVFLNPTSGRYNGGRVCPLGTVLMGRVGTCYLTDYMDKDVGTVPLPVALDRFLGAGAYTIVGYAPIRA